MNMDSPREKTRRSDLRAVVTFVLAIAIIAAAIAAAVVLYVNKPKAAQDVEERLLPSVEVMKVETTDFPVEIEAEGLVESARHALVSAELAARVVGVSPQFRRGVMVRQGDLLLRLEDADFKAALANARSALADAEYNLAQEEARADQARVDWERLGSSRPPTPLTLREPQLAAATARVEAASAQVERASRDLERTRIAAPFDGAIRETRVEVGAVTRPGEPVVELQTTEDLEIRLPLTLEDYGFLKTTADGRVEATITLSATLGGRDHEWPAEPLRLDPEIDRRTLSARLHARVLPATANDSPRFPPVGLFVRARITGITLQDVAVIPRKALRDGNTVIVVTPQNRIEFRPLRIARLTRLHAVATSGVSHGEQVCLTRLNAPVNGMEVLITEPEAVIGN
jgi:RND family efflux transporter MFP subunit